MRPFPYCGTAAQGFAASQSPDTAEAFHFWHVNDFNLGTYERTAIQASTSPALTAFALSYSTPTEDPNEYLRFTVKAVIAYYSEPTARV